MLPPSPGGGGGATNNYFNKNTNTISSPISSSSSSSPYYPPNFEPQNTNNHKNMEEVWKDINLAPLQDHPHGTGDHIDLSVTTPRLILHNTNQNPNYILQDFLAKDPPSRLVSSTRGGPTDTSSGLLLESSQVPPPPPPPPATVLSLYSGPGFDFFDNSDHSNPLCRPLTSSHLSHFRSNVPSFGNPFDGLDASSALLTSFGRKRVQESDTTTGDRRHKRMIKNRESAARSRARKQAYTNELELEVQHLMEENARLRRQQEELRLVAATQLPKKRALYRTSTAPF